MLGAVHPGIGLATDSHPAIGPIPKNGRYRLIPAGWFQQNFPEVAVAILSNSNWTWQLLAVVDGNRQEIEWSENGQIWHPLANEGSTLLSGSRVSWQIYRLYYRYQQTTAAFPVHLQLILAV